MKTSKNTRLLFLALLLFSCADKPTQVAVQRAKPAAVLTDTSNDKSKPPGPVNLNVAAYLVYNDSTTSSFDVLNDKTIALWNTIIGAGDAEKPSEKTKVVLTGELDNLKVVIYNGKKKVINQKLSNVSRELEFIINNTGCKEVRVIVSKGGREIYKNNILYECGE